ncbi:methyltransferase [Fragilaria crotonensis]|nr:methyltransferase [Fragilaria crotonensis]
MPPMKLISMLWFLLANQGAGSALSSRVVAAKSLLSNSKQSSAFPLQRLESSPEYQDLEQRDRSFARALVTTTERRMGQIDKIIDFCRAKPSSTTSIRPNMSDMLVDVTLRLGIAQILFLNVPPHAAVKETVDVLRSTPSVKVPESKIKFANAILRRVSRDGPALLDEHTTSADNVAPWLLERWSQDWGTERVVQISEAFMGQSPVYLSVKQQRGQTVAEHDERLKEVADAIGGTTTILPNGSIRVGDDISGLLNKWPLYDEGIWWVQDVSATLPAVSLCSAFDSKEVENLHVVDMCAAPGGKTAQLVSLGFGRVTAVESSAKRVPRLKKNLARLGMSDHCTVCVADGTEWVPSIDDRPIAGILLDVPCSATGTGSKRPDVMRRSEDIAELLQTQELLANHCVDNILEPGGILVYATCSILKEESEHQVQKLLLRSIGAKMETMPFELGEIPGFDSCIDKNGWMRVLPGSLKGSIGQCDGFFVARLRRVS